MRNVLEKGSSDASISHRRLCSWSSVSTSHWEIDRAPSAKLHKPPHTWPAAVVVCTHISASHPLTLPSSITCTCCSCTHNNHYTASASACGTRAAPLLRSLQTGTTGTRECKSRVHERLSALVSKISSFAFFQTFCRGSLSVLLHLICDLWYGPATSLTHEETLANMRAARAGGTSRRNENGEKKTR